VGDSDVPNSLLTLERPDIWMRALELATSTTGMLYLPKLPGIDGRIWACGYYRPRPTAPPPKPTEAPAPPPPPKPTEAPAPPPPPKPTGKEALEDVLAETERRIRVPEESVLEYPGGKKLLFQAVAVPEGSMEWLLHEVGHWLAATPEERALPNYGLTASTTGHDGQRELEAWAFEDIILAPWGSGRLFAAPSMRDGAAFEHAGPFSAVTYQRVDVQMMKARLSVEQWRSVYRDWVQWGRTKGHRAPWRSER